MGAANWPIKIERGAQFDLTVTYKPDGCNPENVTGWWATGQIRAQKDPTSTLIYEFSTDNGRVTLDGANGKFKISIPVTVVNAPAVAWTRGYWDLKVGPNPADRNEDVKRLVEGEARFDKGVTP